MKQLSKYRSFIALITAVTLYSSCTTPNAANKVKKQERRVPIAINITGSGRDVAFVNLDYYRLKMVDALDNFQSVNLELADEGEKPEITLDLEIDNFNLWPRDERRGRRTLSRTVVVGKDANGRPVYQTARASVDIVQVQRRSNARFEANLKFNGVQPKTFERSFAPNFNYQNTYVDNIQGDPRAVDPLLYFSRGAITEPQEIDFLLELSNREMLRRLSDEIRSYYS